MIARHAKIVEVRRLKHAGQPDAHSARIIAEGLDKYLNLASAEEIAWAERALETGAKLVLTITEASS